MRIKKDVTLSVTTKAQDVAVDFRDFILANNSDATVFFREKETDGKAVTATTGFALPPKTVTPFPLTAGTLSIIGSDAADVRLLFVDCC